MRILFITAYYLPLNAIAAHRIKGFVDSCERSGIEFDVITRKYDEEQCKGLDMFIASKAPSNFNFDYIKEGNVYYTNFDENNWFYQTSKRLPKGIRGLFNYLVNDVFHYGWFGFIIKVFEQELIGNKYDFIVSSYGPLVSLMAANRLSKKYAIPFVADFRDSFIDGSEKFPHAQLKKWQLKSILKNCFACTFASGGMQDIFYSSMNGSLKSIPSEIIYNGTELNRDDHYSNSDKDIVERFKGIQSANDIVLLYTGTLYAGQDINFYIEAVNEFLNLYPGVKIALVFLGLPENNLPELFKYSFMHFLPRVQFKTSLFLQKSASALLSPVWLGRYTGFTGKIFEYLSSGNFVIVGPNPQKDISHFLQNFENALVCNEVDQFYKILFQIKDSKSKLKSVLRQDLLSREHWSDQFISYLVRLKKTK